MPFSRVFDTLWNGKRHVIINTNQINHFNNQNINAIGDWEKPKVQLLGVRGAPDNTVYHPTNYFINQHNPQIFIKKINIIYKINTNQKTFKIHQIITNLNIFNFNNQNKTIQLHSLHPNIKFSKIKTTTKFTIKIKKKIQQTHNPTTKKTK